MFVVSEAVHVSQVQFILSVGDAGDAHTLINILSSL